MTRAKNNSWIMVACLLVFIYIVAIRPSDKAKAVPKATWEHKVISLDKSSEVERALNQLGSEGWELVQMVRTDETQAMTGIYLLKRAK